MVDGRGGDGAVLTRLGLSAYASVESWSGEVGWCRGGQVATSAMRVVHLGRSTCHAISDRVDKSTRISPGGVALECSKLSKR